MKPNRIVNTILALALAGAFGVPALAQAQADEPPARVGRVALTQGQVSIGSDVGAEMMAAQVNWPVTSGNTITTAQGARTELRVGSTSIRLDGDSSLEVEQLDDATMRLRLYYGTASVRVQNPDVLAGFELETPQARVRLQQAGRVRIDAERVQGVSAVTVFDGAALVDAGGSQLTVRAGKRAELGDDDVRTLAAIRDAFDDWALARDRYDDGAASARYVGSEMTGYEDLDRYGSWSQDADYGPLWMPTVAAGWVPYRDGSWAWVDPWGWTWVDNAPWGYAPFHYGRWVNVHNRWAWAPGRRTPGRGPDRPVWAPALVGWVGGAGWNVAFRDRNHPLPATGWYPLSPHDRFVPSYRASENRVRWLNDHVRNDPRRPRDYRPQGLTVVPQDRFGQPGRVNVPRAPIAAVAPAQAQHVPAGAPPAAPAWANRPHREGGQERGQDRGPAATLVGGVAGAAAGRGQERGQERVQGERGTGRIDTGAVEHDGLVRQRANGQWHGPVRQVQEPATPGLVAPATPARPLPVTSPTPHLPSQPLSTVTSPTPRSSPQPLTTASPAPAAAADNWRQGRIERPERAERPERVERPERPERQERREGAEAWRGRQPASAPAQPVQAQPAPAAQPARVERQEARVERAPAPAARPAAAAANASAREEPRQHTDEHGRNQRER